jgi:hypothetical protein
MSRTKQSPIVHWLVPAMLAMSSVTTTAVAQGTPGWTFAMKMSIDSGAGTPPTAMAMRQQKVPGKTRMEFSTPAFAGTQMDGMYTIITDADSSIASVVPGMKMATIMPVGAMMGMDMSMDMPQVKSGAEHLVTDSLEDLGATDEILGRPTHHYRETRVGTLDIALGSQMCVQHINTVTDEWLSTDPELSAILTMNHSAIADSPFQAFAPDLTSTTSKLPKGIPLRTLIATTTRGGTGKPRTVTTRIDLTELSQAQIADSLFAVPASFNSVDMRKMMADMPPHMMDSAMQNAAESQMKTLCDSGDF